MTPYKARLLKRIDKLVGYESKLEFLNQCYLKASNINQEIIVLEMIKELKVYGQ